MDRTNSTGGDDAIPPALAAILDEMRSDEIETEDGVIRLDGYADQIESEVRRAHEEWEAVARAQDVAQTVMMEEIEKLRAPGSVAAMRRVLEEVEGAIFEDEPGRFWLADAEEILRRVRAALAAPPEPPPNVSAMREALEWATSTMDVSQDVLDETEDWENEVVCWVSELQEKARSALAAPARNCDVGSVEEQAERFTRFCLEYHSRETLCSRCPIVKNGFPPELVDKCQLAWAQMPFAQPEGEVK